MSDKVFVSYRRADGAGMAGRLYDRMNTLFPGRVFLDTDDIEPGADFAAKINESLRSCRLLVVLVGKDWLLSTKGRSRIGDPNDYVTMEIQAAIDNQVPIIPVLLDGATFPEENSLPTKLVAGLHRRNAVEIRHSSFERDCMFLMQAVYGYLGLKPPTKLEQLLEGFATKLGYTGFHYDEKARSWHAVLALIFGGLAGGLTILGLAGMPIDLEVLALTLSSAFPGLIGKNSSTKGTLAKAGLLLSGASALVQFVLFEYGAIWHS